MAYTKGQMTVQILDRVENQINLDNAVRKTYVKKYLSAAIPYLTLKQYYEDQKTGEPEGLKEFDNQFVGAMQKTDVLYNEERQQLYIIIPGTRMAMIHGKDIIFIGPMANQSKGYYPISQQEYNSVARSINLSSKRYYMLEANKYAYLINHPQSVKELGVKKLWSLEEIADDELLPITDDLAIQAMELCVDWFLGKRQLPPDYVNDNMDIKTKN